MSSWWHESRQNKAIAKAHGEAEGASLQAQYVRGELQDLAGAVHRRVQELELKVDILVDLLQSAVPGVDARMIELRLEARLDELRASSMGPQRPCVSCGQLAEADAEQTPFGPVCATCGASA